MKKLALILALFCITFLNAQSSWKKIDSENYEAKSELVFRKLQPKKFQFYNFDINQFKNEIESQSRDIIFLPNNNGTLTKYKITKTSYLETGLQKKFPNIKSYSAVSVEDQSTHAKISMGLDGVHIMITSNNHPTIYIDPYTKDNKVAILYDRNSISKSDDFECMVKEAVKTEFKKIEQQKNANDSKLRTYRLALVCTGEYSQFQINRLGIPTTATDQEKKAAVLSAMNTTITRVNEVYERELSVRMVIVNDNDKVIFLNSVFDGLSNNNANSLIDESQTKCDTEIGSPNYDIGHAFSTGDGGLAGVGVVCITGQKARAMTGRPQPVGDAFDIDYVAHEMGHQFGAFHTQNNNCNRSSETSVEPGSGSTIMGYAGICAPNVQSNSDDYFHAVSIAQMWNTIQSSATCAAETDTANLAPTANAGSDYSVPRSTPLVLRGAGSDTDSSNLTYCWEQIDNEVASMPPVSTNIAGPAFRSLPPSTSSDRYLPTLATVVGGSLSTTWEVLPSVARDMDFALTVRDNNPGGGASARDDMRITVTNAEPFTVTSQNDGSTWNAGSTQTITWHVSTTNQAPINCQNVKIRLSTDGGSTFPIVLAESTPNDGSHQITVPNNVTSTARIMIEAVDNIFYNVNSTAFPIEITTPTFIVTNTTSTQSACNIANGSVQYTLNFDFINGFNETVTFTTQNTPNGSTVTFEPSSINTSGTVTMTVSNFASAAVQDYTIDVNATSNSVSQSTTASLKIVSTSFSNFSLLSPSNNSTNVSIIPDLSWQNVPEATSYTIEIALDTNFNNIVISDTSNTNSYTVSTPLSGATQYFWRVKPINPCGEGAFSSTFSFTTVNPSYCSSTFTDEAGGTEHITNVTFNTINNDSGNDTVDGYQDFTSITTTLEPNVSYPISITMDTGGFQDHCYVFIDWNQDYIFDLTTERYDLGTILDDIGTATANITVPSNATNGSTRMRVLIEYDDPTSGFGEGACDSDHLTEWGETEDYTIVVDNPASIEDTAFENFSLYPNPSSGTFKLKFQLQNSDGVAITLYDISGRKIEKKKFSNTSSIFSEELNFNQISSGLYLLQIQNGNKQTTKKIVIR